MFKYADISIFLRISLKAWIFEHASTEYIFLIDPIQAVSVPSFIGIASKVIKGLKNTFFQHYCRTVGLDTWKVFEITEPQTFLVKNPLRLLWIETLHDWCLFWSSLLIPNSKYEWIEVKKAKITSHKNVNLWKFMWKFFYW